VDGLRRSEEAQDRLDSIGQTGGAMAPRTHGVCTGQVIQPKIACAECEEPA
jgi:hypothetical protein